MHRIIVRASLIMGAVLIAASAGMTPAVPEARSGVPATQLYLDLAENASRPGAGPRTLSLAAPIPPNSVSWHELYPTLNANHAQESYTDDGDGVISAGDFLRLDGMDYRILWAGPTYFVTIGSTTHAWEPSLGPHDPAQPVGETWNEVLPTFGSSIAVTSWGDNGTGVLDPGDDLTIVADGGSPVGAKVDLIGTNITVEPVPVVPTRSSTWSFLKRIAGNR